MAIKIFIFLVVLSLNCFADPIPDFNLLNFHGFNPESLSQEADAGLKALFAGDGFHSAVPFRILKKLEKNVPFITPQDQFYAFGRIPSPPTRNSPEKSFSVDLSIFARKDNFNQEVMFANSNCFQCHAGVVNGIVTAGLGNSHVDQASIGYTGSMIANYAITPSFIRGSGTPFEEKILGEFAEEIFTKINPTFKNAKTRGENFGPLSVWFFLKSLIDPATQGLKSVPYNEPTSFDKIFQDENGKEKALTPIDANPWWLYKYKKTIYRYADPVPENKRPAHFAINFTALHTEVNQNHKAHVTAVGKILNFVKETTSPLYPHALDPHKVALGEQIFHGKIQTESGEIMKCHKCHGEYQKKSGTSYNVPGEWWIRYKDIVKDVETDPAYNLALQSYKPLTERLEGLKTFFTEDELVPIGSVPDKAGYLAPPLDGIWASAPYFHNGSVPTLEQVLDFKKRPEYWKKDNQNPFAYNLKQVGLAHTVIDKESYLRQASEARGKPVLDKSSIEFRAIYNTTDFARNNKGHTFGKNLSDAERSALIEFLKSLGGPGMQSLNQD